MITKQAIADLLAREIRIAGLDQSVASYMFNCLRKEELIAIVEANNLSIGNIGGAA